VWFDDRGDLQECSGRLVVVSAVARQLWGEMDVRRAAGDLEAWMMAGLPRSWSGSAAGAWAYGTERRHRGLVADAASQTEVASHGAAAHGETPHGAAPHGAESESEISRCAAPRRAVDWWIKRGWGGGTGSDGVGGSGAGGGNRGGKLDDTSHGVAPRGTASHGGGDDYADMDNVNGRDGRIYDHSDERQAMLGVGDDR
jgi:hypothetical protein